MTYEKIQAPSAETRWEPSAGQRGMWIAARLGTPTSAYHVATANRLTGQIDVPALQRSLDRLAARHAILRARYCAEGDELVMVAERRVRLEIDQIRLPAMSAAEAGQAARKLAERVVRAPFDLDRAPLWRVALIRLGPGRHVLVLCLHHALCDGESVQQLLTEWSDEYAADLRGAPSPDVAAAPFAEYAEHERRLLATGAADLRFWRERLRGLRPAGVPGTPAPGDGPGADQYRFDVEDTLGRRLDDFCGEAGLTRYATLLSAFAVTLAGAGDGGDLAVGTTMSTRHAAEFARTIGPLFTTVVLRLSVDPSMPFRDVALLTREIVIEALEHAAVPYEDLLGRIRADNRSAERNPLFRVFFEIDHEAEQPLRLTGVDAEMFPFTHPAAKTDLMVALGPRGAGLTGTITYRTDVYAGDDIRGFAESYLSVLAGALDDPDRPCAELIGVPPEGADPSASGGFAPVPPLCAHELFERQVAATPDATAVRAAGPWPVELTYAQLDARANRLARTLRANGVNPQSRVAILLHRSADLITAFLAVWKAGGAYVPLDPALPAERSRYEVEDSNAVVVLSQASLAGSAEGLGRPVLLVDGALDTDCSNPYVPLRPEAPAYVIYTSGSTGRPKGVLVEHGTLVNFLMWCVRRYGSSGSGGAPVFSSVAFDMIVPNLFTPLLMGETVHVVGPDVGPDRLGETLAASAPFSFIKLTPGHLELLSRQLSAEQATGLAHLLVVGADTFPPDILAAWRRLDPDTPVLNEYGPTEATVANCAADVSAGAVTRAGNLPIGRPIPNTTMHVLDESLRPCPAGRIGQLYIGGGCVARGYLGRPGLTASRFVADPYGPAGARLYRTGDLGRILPDGNFEFLGRSDDQIKIRGYRVEPGEVEAALTAQPGIRGAVVTKTRTPAGHDTLVAYVVAADGAVPSREELRSHLAAQLPEHCVPSTFVVLDALPLNENGKLDRKRLPAPLWGGDHSLPAGPGPWEPIARIWEQLLRLPADEVGPDDDFFALGGNSLLGLSVIDRVRARYGVTVSLEQFLRAPTVAALGELVGASASLPAREPRRSLSRLGDGGSGRALVFVHPLGGTVFCYRHLIAELGGVTPVYGLTLPALLGERSADDSIEDMAARYAGEIATTVTGPPVLVAWSAGAVTAFETARRLRTDYGVAARLVLIDPSDTGDAVGWRRYKRELRQIRTRLTLADERQREEIFGMVVRSDLFAAMGIDPDTGAAYTTFPQQVFEIWQQQLEVLGAYEPEPYDGEIVVITAAERDADTRDAVVRGWQQLTDHPVRHTTTAGGHMSMLEPPAVRKLADAVRSAATR